MRPRTLVLTDAALGESEESDEEEEEEEEDDWTDEEADEKEVGGHQPLEEEEDEADDLPDTDPAEVSLLSSSSVSADAVRAADARFAAEDGADEVEAQASVQEMTDEEYARALQAEEEDLYALQEEAMAEDDAG